MKNVPIPVLFPTGVATLGASVLAQPAEAPLILVVDDDQHGREGLVEFLVACGYRVIQAADGAEALQKVKLRQPAIVLLDLALPRIDGWHVAQTIRRELALPGTRLIAMSGLDYPNELARAVECGCDMVLPKPCDPGRLLEAIRTAADPAGAPTSGWTASRQ